MDARPNILLLMTDQQTHAAMSCAGNPHLRTPAMDGLAARGVRFTQSYVTQPLCLPCRSSLQTARYPHEIGTINNGRSINGEFPMLGRLVGQAGYDCAYIGKWHVGTGQEEAGYHVVHGDKRDHDKTAAAVAWLRERRSSVPFFLTVSYTNPHNVCQLARGQKLPDGAIGEPPTQLGELPPLPANFEVPADEPTALREVQRVSREFHYPTADWDERRWREYLWGYYRLVEKVDAEIARVLAALEETGRRNDTLIIFVSDHGEGVAMHHWNQKQILYDQAVRVPTVVVPPGTTDAQTCDALVSMPLDVAATILDAAGAQQPPSMLGQSLLPVVRGAAEPHGRNCVFCETMFARGSRRLGPNGRMVRSRQFKYCVYDAGEQREQLFDMDADPGETNNLADETGHADVLAEHRQRLLAWADATNDRDFDYAMFPTTQRENL